MANHIYETGEWLFLSGMTLKDKSSHTIHNDTYLKNFWGSNKNMDLKHPIVLEFLNEIIPHKTNETNFMDKELSQEEIQGIKDVFEREVKRVLQIRKPATSGYTITVFGKEVLIDTRNQAVTDGRLRVYNKIYMIAKGCLEQQKPMYISMD